MIAGILDLTTAFATKDENDLWWLQLILGIAQILIGFWAIGYAGRSISLLVVWVGATALARGISSLFVGVRAARRRQASCAVGWPAAGDARRYAEARGRDTTPPVQPPEDDARRRTAS